MEPEKASCPYPEPPPPYSTMPPTNQNYGIPPQGVAAGSAFLSARGPHQPPPGGVPVFPMAGQAFTGYPQPGNPAQAVVMGAPQGGQVGSVTVVSVAQWGPYPMQIGCPHCGAQVLTETNASPGLLTWLLAGALVFFGCWLGCCLIPCCIPECQDIEHRCPNCKHHLGSFRRL